MTRGNRRQLRPLPAVDGGGDRATVDQVTQLLGTAPVAGQRRRRAGFSLTEVSPAIRAMAFLFGVFLSYAVLRIHELYAVFNIPRLPFLMAVATASAIVLAVPLSGWRQIYEAAPSIGWQALLVALAVMTAPIGIWPGGSINSLLTSYSISLAAFFASVVFLRDRRALGTTIRVMAATAASMAIFVLLHGQDDPGPDGRVWLSWTLDPNDLAMLFVALIPLALYRAQRKGPRSMGWYAIAALFLAAIVPTQSRGAILGLGAIAMTLIAFGQSGWRRSLYLLGTGCAAVGVFIFANALGATERLGDFSDYAGGESRTAIWKRGLVWMSWRPWGYGLDNFPIYFGWMNGNERAAHNSFVQIGVELGLLGLLAFAMLFLHTGRDLLRQRRHAMSLSASDPAARGEANLVSYVLAMMAGTATTGFFLSKAYAGIMLFVQGVGIATLVGYPFRGQVAPPSAGAAPPTARRQRGNRVPRGVLAATPRAGQGRG